jgi:hypothetical protein
MVGIIANQCHRLVNLVASISSVALSSISMCNFNLVVFSIQAIPILSSVRCKQLVREVQGEKCEDQFALADPPARIDVFLLDLA